ncbi:hypothetical protein N6L24_08245 [Cognatishimia sp. SS12]|uniref:hypothetical protein n=1 Tax=Cognatishimia sp. SS12 TaxID=2979465 RepID=UPI00232C85DC|nr:hypothetical protein [Cognatishimia sp. SS12]MDC0738268.1 hypothetical protein [Cognatishimia sp. SS12]
MTTNPHEADTSPLPPPFPASQTPAEAQQALAVLRARDFWAAIVLFVLSIFFLWRTSFIPLWGANRAGVSGSDWYNSAAIVPLGIFTGLLLLSAVLMVVAVRDGGAKRALSAVGIGWHPGEALRFGTIALILFFYIAGLVPRVDFILGSGLLITALIYGYHGGHPKRMMLAAAVLSLAGSYAMIRHLPQSEWTAHDDDWLVLILWAALTIWVFMRERQSRVHRAIPIIAVIAPTLLVCAMAFGFRQNVPNRGGLLFKQIEYHYYVTLKPIWSQK